MVAGIEQIAGADNASFVAAREPGWHKLGITLDSTFSSAEGMKIAHLAGWNVRKLAAFAEETILSDTGVTTVKIPGKGRYFTVRTNPVTGEVEYLGDVGSDYTVIQNEENADFLDTLVDQAGSHWETMGSLFGGTRTFMSMKLPAHIDVAGDITDAYLIALNSHDGSCAFQVCVSLIRPVCHNTVTAAFRQAKHKHSIRHTKNATARVQQAREALGMTFKYIDVFADQARELQSQAFSDVEFNDFLMSLHDVKDMDDVSTRKANIMQSIADLWTGSPTLLDTKGTRYGAYQAVTEYTTWFSGAHGKGEEQVINRTQRELMDDKLRTKAFQLLSA